MLAPFEFFAPKPKLRPEYAPYEHLTDRNLQSPSPILCLLPRNDCLARCTLLTASFLSPAMPVLRVYPYGDLVDMVHIPARDPISGWGPIYRVDSHPQVPLLLSGARIFVILWAITDEFLRGISERTALSNVPHSDEEATRLGELFSGRRRTPVRCRLVSQDISA